MSEEKKELEMRLQALKSQYDGNLAKQEKELKEVKAKVETDAEENKKKLQEKTRLVSCSMVKNVTC